MEPERFVFDSYAMLAFFEGEHGGDRVQALMEEAAAGRSQLLLSVVNLGEIVYLTEHRKGLLKSQEALAHIDELPIEVVNADRALTLAAAHIKAHWPMAYADCFAAALAQLRKATLVTGDPEFKPLEAAAIVPVSWLTLK